VVTNAGACARWLAAGPPNLSEARAAAERIVQDANRASDVINRIRALVAGGVPRTTELQVAEVIRESVTLVQGEARARDVSLVASVPASLPPVAGDRIQMQQVLLNLALNAIEAMSKVLGRPRVLQISAERDGDDQVRVAFRDSGPGLEPAQRDRIFDAFYSTKDAGIGMGLAISRSIVEAHGGRLWATPNEDVGETFQFTCPVVAGALR
jgi:signal transduction histidine kinase